MAGLRCIADAVSALFSCQTSEMQGSAICRPRVARGNQTWRTMASEATDCARNRCVAFQLERSACTCTKDGHADASGSRAHLQCRELRLYLALSDIGATRARALRIHSDRLVCYHVNRAADDLRARPAPLLPKALERRAWQRPTRQGSLTLRAISSRSGVLSVSAARRRRCSARFAVSAARSVLTAGHGLQRFMGALRGPCRFRCDGRYCSRLELLAL